MTCDCETTDRHFTPARARNQLDRYRRRGATGTTRLILRGLEELVVAAETLLDAGRRGHAERITFRHGDLVALSAELPAADLVTMDRVVCCYPDLEALIP